MGLKEKILQLSESNFNEAVSIRRHLHQNPELSFGEFKTSAYIASKLDEYGIPYKKGIAVNGILATIEGKNPSKKIIALRADFDALPVEELNDSPYKSINKGVMHACGHDIHASSLLGTGKILNEIKNEFEGTILLVFQPAEERLPGGARLMLEADLFGSTQPELMLAQHVLPELDAGLVGFKSGMYMASCDEIFITISGKGGHAAMPHNITDTVLIASHIVVALQQIVSRNANAIIPSVLSFGKFIANGAPNILPSETKLEGTFRTIDEKWRTEAHEKIKKMACSIAEGMGGTCDCTILKGYPYLVNNDEITEKAVDYAKQYLGNDKVVGTEKRMTSEDFSYFTQKYPSTFYRLGVKNDSKGCNFPLHSAYFDADEDALKTGMGVMAWLAVSFL
jgi:amidohydrolase